MNIELRARLECWSIFIQKGIERNTEVHERELERQVGMLKHIHTEESGKELERQAGILKHIHTEKFEKELERHRKV